MVCDVVGRIPAFQPGGVRNFNVYPGTECVLCVLSCVVSRGGPDILLTTDFRETVLMYV